MKKTITMSDVRAANKNHFARGQARFFGDVSYKILHGKQTKKAYMLRCTDMWSDMFGGAKKYVWVINHINQQTLEIGDRVDQIFPTEQAARDWLNQN